jgi:hypothetical protein
MMEQKRLSQIMSCHNWNKSNCVLDVGFRSAFIAQVFNAFACDITYIGLDDDEANVASAKKSAPWAMFSYCNIGSGSSIRFYIGDIDTLLIVNKYDLGMLTDWICKQNLTNLRYLVFYNMYTEDAIDACVNKDLAILNKFGPWQPTAEYLMSSYYWMSARKY